MIRMSSFFSGRTPVRERLPIKCCGGVYKRGEEGGVLFVCPVVQRIARSPQLCRTPLSDAKQEINVARCVCLCVCVRVCLQTLSGCQSFSLGIVHIYACVCGRVCVCVVSKRDRVASAHKPKADSRQRKQSGAIALAPPPNLQINVPARFNSQADQSC